MIKKVDNILFKSRVDAENVLTQLNNIVTTYGHASLADYYNLAGIIPSFSDTKYGWLDVKDATIRQIGEGYYIILPNLIRLEKEEPKNIIFKVLNKDTYIGPFRILSKRGSSTKLY